jgi:hypothetical protein
VRRMPGVVGEPDEMPVAALCSESLADMLDARDRQAGWL